MDTELIEHNILLDKPLNKMKWRPRLELLKNHKIGIITARPEGATDNKLAKSTTDFAKSVAGEQAEER